MGKKKLKLDRGVFVCSPYEPYCNGVKQLVESDKVFNLFCLYRVDMNLSIKQFSELDNVDLSYKVLRNVSSDFEWTKRRNMYQQDRICEVEESKYELQHFFLSSQYKYFVDRERENKLLHERLMKQSELNPQLISRHANSKKSLAEADMIYFRACLRALGLTETIKDIEVELNKDVDLPALQDMIQDPAFIEENMKPFEIFKEKQEMNKEKPKLENDNVKNKSKVRHRRRRFNRKRR